VNSDSPQTWYGDEDGDDRSETVSERYSVRELLGEGGVGRVLAAWDHALDREVAIKEVRHDAPASAVRRFLDEAKLTSRLEHPNIIPVHDAGQRPDGSLYYVMRLIRGTSMLEAIRQASSPAQRLALLPHLEDVCQAMAHAHGKGVVHRDLKPANVMLGEHGQTLVVDWGIAKVLGKADAGAIEGTPAYMSPEQARGEPPDAQGDVWSLGAILFEVLTGHPPFHGADPLTLLDRVRTQPPPRLRDEAPEVPAELAAIVDKALSVDRSRRFRSAQELALDISAWRDGRRVRAHEYRLVETVRLMARRHKLPLAALGLGLLVALVVAALSFQRIRLARDEALLAEQATREALAQALVQHARTRSDQGEHLAAALLAAESLRLSDSPEGRGWLALSLSASPWHLTSVQGPADCAEVLPLGGLLACVTTAGIEAWNPGAPQSRAWSLPLEGIVRVALSGDGQTLAALGADRLYLIGASDGSLRATVAVPRSQHLAWSADSRHLLLSSNRDLRLLSAQGELQDEQRVGSGIQGMRFFDDDTVLVVLASGWSTWARLPAWRSILRTAAWPWWGSTAASRSWTAAPARRWRRRRCPRAGCACSPGCRRLTCSSGPARPTSCWPGTRSCSFGTPSASKVRAPRARWWTGPTC
jgi:Protein kinase domain